MQIHELDNFIGDPGQGDFLAIDDGNWTRRIDAERLVNSVMAQSPITITMTATDGTTTGVTVVETT